MVFIPFDVRPCVIVSPETSYRASALLHANPNPRPASFGNFHGLPVPLIIQKPIVSGIITLVGMPLRKLLCQRDFRTLMHQDMFSILMYHMYELRPWFCGPCVSPYIQDSVDCKFTVCRHKCWLYVFKLDSQFYFILYEEISWISPLATNCIIYKRTLSMLDFALEAFLLCQIVMLCLQN